MKFKDSKGHEVWKRHLNRAGRDKQHFRIIRFAEMFANETAHLVIDEDIEFNEAADNALEIWKVKAPTSEPGQKDAFSILEIVWEMGDQLADWRSKRGYY